MLNEKTKKIIFEHLNDDISRLALSGKQAPDDVDFTFVLQQIKTRKSIRHKIPTWYKNMDIILPAQLSVEQSSSELTANFKAGLIKGNSLVDLTGGFGIDCAFLSKNFSEVTYIEISSDLCEIAKHNFSTLGLSNISVKNLDSAEYLKVMSPVDCIFIDPARRSQSGKKTVVFSDCEPNVVEILPLLLEKTNSVLVKTSPMHDITLALSELKNVVEVFVVAVENECKELLFLLKKEHSKEANITAVNLSSKKEIQALTFTYEAEKASPCSLAEVPKTYLYEPNVAILKSGAFKITSQKYDISKLHPNSHLYTSDILHLDFPGRIFVVDSYFSLSKQELSKHLQNIKKANIAVRNFPETVEKLRKRLKLSDGGDVFLFATTLKNNEKVIVKTKKLLLPE